MRQAITEEEDIHKGWYLEAQEMTLDRLAGFLHNLTEDYAHDYGTICHAISAAAVAAATAVNKSDAGGITGFQAGCIMWGFIKHWMHYGDHPMHLVDYEDLLYPQYERKFRTINKATWNYLQENARSKLASDSGVVEVREHWQSIADGKVPFGYEVSDD